MLAVMGIVCKSAIAPAVNILTDMLFIPGGSTVAGISISFLLVGANFVPGKYTATKMAFIQGFMALVMGYSSFQGLFILISYTIPGVVIDMILHPSLIRLLNEQNAIKLAGTCGVISGLLVTNTAFFNLEPLPFFLFCIMGILSGMMGGELAFMLVCRLRLFIQNQNMMYDRGD